MKNKLFYLIAAVILSLTACNEEYEASSVTSVSLTRTAVLLRLGEMTTVGAIIEPAGAESNVIWSSNDEKVAFVDPYGGIYAVGQGSTTIIATTTVGRKVATCAVYVDPVRVTRIELNKSAVYLIPEETTAIEATVFPQNATNKNVIWTSSDEEVAIVDLEGSSPQIVAVGFGNATITATTEDGEFKATCLVTVAKILVNGVIISHDKISSYQGETLQLTATVIPDNASFLDVVWSSSDEEVATVSDNGLVTIISGEDGATAVIRVTSDDNPLAFAECTITVIAETDQERMYRFFHGNDSKTWTWDPEVAQPLGQNGWLAWNGLASWWWGITHEGLAGQVTANEAGATMTFEAPDIMRKTLADGTVLEGTFKIDFERTFNRWALGTLVITGGDEALTIPSRASWNGNPKEIPIKLLTGKTMSLMTHPDGFAGAEWDTGYGYLFRVVEE